MPEDPKDLKGQFSQVIPVENHEPDDLYREGSEYFKAREYDKARARFERYTLLRPDDPAGFHFLARVYYHQNINLDKAEECVKKALELSDGSRETHYLETLGIIYIQKGDYARAEEVFVYALSEDRGDDRKHTYSLDFYLNLVQKRIKKKPKQETARKRSEPPKIPAGAPRGSGGRSRQPFFIIPSIILHALVLLFMGYLSSQNVSVRQGEDFTYVDVQPREEAQDAGQASQAEAPAGEEGAAPTAQTPREEAVPAPAPVTPRREAEAGSVSRSGLSQAAPVAPAPERPGQGGRHQAGGKAMARLGRTGGQEDYVPRAAGEKALDIKGAPRPGTSAGDVEFARKDLGRGPAQSSKSGAREASAAGMSDRSASAPDLAGGIYFGETKRDRALRPDKKTRAALGGPRPEEQAAYRGGEKKLVLAGPGRPGFIDEESRFKPSALDISGASSRRSRGRAAEAFSSVGRSRPAEPQAAPGDFKPETSARDVTTAGKARGSLGAPVEAEDQALNGLDTEKRMEVASAKAPGMFTPQELPGARRSLDISSRRGPAGRSRGGRESLASLDRKSQSGVTAGAGSYGAAAPGSGSNGDSTGGSKEAARGLAPAKEESFPGASFFEKAADRVSQALGIGRKDAPLPEADPRRVASLGIPTGEAGKGQPAAAPRQVAGGYAAAPRFGEGEKARPALAGIRAGEGAGRPAASVAEGGKKMSEGALGTPGSRGPERYSPMKTENRPAAMDKTVVVPERTQKLLALNQVSGPSVSIASPRSGVTSSLSQVISGTVSNPMIRQVILSVNNDSRVVSVERGSFQAAVTLSRGRNTITAVAFDSDGNVGRDSVDLNYNESHEGAPVTIASPKDGQKMNADGRSFVPVKGTVGDLAVRKAKLVFNDTTMEIPVNRGRFEQEVPLEQAHNTVFVEVTMADGKVSRSQLVHVDAADLKPRDVIIILTWDKPRSGFGLRVSGPGGGHGRTDQSKGDFGPEVFAQEKADRGIYTISADHRGGGAHATVTVILYGDNPSRRIVRVFGPHFSGDAKEVDAWEVARFKMPEGIFLEE